MKFNHTRKEKIKVLQKFKDGKLSMQKFRAAQLIFLWRDKICLVFMKWTINYIIRMNVKSFVKEKG